MAARAGATRRQQWDIGSSAAAARTGNARQQWRRRGSQQGPGRGQCGGNNKHQQDWGRCCDDSCEDDSEGDAARQGQRGDDNGGILHIATTSVVRPTVLVVARARAARQRQWGTAAAAAAWTRTTAKATVVRKGERGSNNRSSVSHLSFIFLFFGRAQDTVTKLAFLLDTTVT